MNNIFDSLEYWSKKNPEQIAINNFEQKLTYRALFQISKRIAYFCRQHNIKKGETALIQNANEIEAWAIALGLAHEGITTCINRMSTNSVGNHIFDWYFTPEAISDIPKEKIIKSELDWFANLPDFSSVKLIKQQHLPPEHINNLILTSGTTGLPKLVPWTLRNIYKRAVNNITLFNHPRPISLLSLNAGVMLLHCLGGVISGSTTFIPIKSPRKLFTYLNEHKNQSLYASPAILNDLLNTFELDSVPIKIDTIYSAGSFISPKTC
jgi:acyl-CoA synthetase (AMP-forming)/AMP-acid ligase II